MRRTITIQDDGSPVEARAVLDVTGDGQRILELTLGATDGRGIEPLDLRLFEVLGLRLPAAGGLPSVKEAAAALVVAPAPKSRRTPATKKPPAKKASSGRTYHRAPPIERLAELYREHDGKPAAIGAVLGVPPRTVSDWLKTRRTKIEALTA